MIRRLLIIAVLATLADIGVEADSSKPNIVFIFADDQPDSALGCYGNPVAKTPTLDRLATQGVRFSNAFVTQPICWVSRTSILTGLTARGYGTPEDRDLARADAVETFYSDILSQNGYRTGYYGKWHARMPEGFNPEAHFDEFEAIGRDPFSKSSPTAPSATRPTSSSIAASSS